MCYKKIYSVFEQGYIARNVGYSRDENPFPEDGDDETKDNRLNWFDGWDAAEREFCSGTRTIGY